MTAVPEVAEAIAEALAGSKRVAADLPEDVMARLRVWAAMRGKPVAHVVAELVCKAVPTDAQLAEQIGGRNGHAQH